jgi:uncharacterized protein (UPF0216 family)
MSLVEIIQDMKIGDTLVLELKEIEGRVALFKKNKPFNVIEQILHGFDDESNDEIIMYIPKLNLRT